MLDSRQARCLRHLLTSSSGTKVPTSVRRAAYRLLSGKATRTDRYWFRPELILEEAGVTPDSWQVEVLRCWEKDVLLNVTRQGGKSFTTAALAIRTALLEPPALILVLSRSLRQAGELFQAKLKPLYRAMGEPVKVRRETALQLELENGSRLISLPGNEETIRGYSGVNLLILDEASRIPDDLFRSVRPMLAVSGGRMAALSTPWGRRGWFFEQATSLNPTWRRWVIPASKCPRITPEFLRQERLMHGETWFKQEYCCSFEDVVDAAFAEDIIRAAVSDGVEALVL